MTSLIIQLARQAEREYRLHEQEADDLAHHALARHEQLCEAISSIKAETMDDAAVQILMLRRLVLGLADLPDGDAKRTAKDQATRLFYSVFGVVLGACQIDLTDCGRDVYLSPAADPWQPPVSGRGGQP